MTSDVIKNVLITGGSGLIGQSLTRKLLSEGFNVGWLSRRALNNEKIKSFTWDIRNSKLDSESIEWSDAIIHLAGANVAGGRWTRERKKEILDSRINSTQLLYEKIRISESKPSVFISASAVGYYGSDTGEIKIDEDSLAGKDFLAEVVSKWEDEIDKISDLGLRVVKNRIGIVLSVDGGALEPMMRTTRFGIASPLGSGKQYMSWIHINDLVNLFIIEIQDKNFRGTYNAVAPNPVTNRAFTKSLAKAMNKPTILPNVPPFVLKLLFGEMSTIVLGGNRVSSKRLKETDFTFSFPNLDTALKDLLKG